MKTWLALRSLQRPVGPPKIRRDLNNIAGLGDSSREDAGAQPSTANEEAQQESLASGAGAHGRTASRTSRASVRPYLP
jgi:hypothetical protein